MKIHELKADICYFDAVWEDKKTFEIRFNDRNFQVGDLLLLKEYDESTLNKYLSREILCEIKYIFSESRYLQEGHVILAIEIIKKINKKC